MTFFAAMYHVYPNVFVKRILGCDRSRIARFWTVTANRPALKAHPCRSHPHLKSHCVPIAIHGDGIGAVACGKTYCKSVDVYNWSSLIGKGATLLTSYLIFLIVKANAVTSVGQNTVDNFWNRLCWSLQVWETGTFPHADEEGLPINYNRGPL